MATSVVDLAALLDGIPSGAWVAISEEQSKVLAYGADPQAVLSKARSKGEEKPLITRVPDHQFSMFL